MAAKSSGLDARFVESQRQRLRSLRETLLAAAQAGEDEESYTRSESAGTPREYEDDAQKLAALELEGNLVVRDIARLERVDRALTKIEEGTFMASPT
jgi:RNA polymerase-binding transcription factor DksA